MNAGITITFMGTNGWYDTEMGNTVSTLIDSRDFSIILDAGIGIYKLDRYIDYGKPAYLFLSHFHLDHIYGLHMLNKFRFEKGLCILGQNGTREILRTLVNEPFTAPMDTLPYRTTVMELPEKADALPFHAQALPLVHASHTLGLRLELNGKIISYCPDTGYCKNAVILSEKADVVIAECAYRPGEYNNDWPHLNPETAAAIARDAGARMLYLFHFDASRYTDRESRIMAEKTAQALFPATTATFDGLTVTL